MLKVIFILFLALVANVTFLSAQEASLCDCWLSKLDPKILAPKDCKEQKELTDQETLKIMKCLIAQKGNKSPYIGVVLRNNVSDTFTSSPTEVVALFYISYLFYGNEDFADAMVLIYDFNLKKPNSDKSVKVAHKSYKKWLERVEMIGLKKAREMKIDPLANTKVSWY